MADSDRLGIRFKSNYAAWRALVESIDGAIIDASYDGDGFVMWWKHA